MDERLGQISRRRLLKRFGAGTAVVWSAPVLSSITASPFAQASPTCRPYDCLDPGTDLCGRNVPRSRCPVPPDCAEGHCNVLLDGSCFCNEGHFCNRVGDQPICESDADCGPAGRCAPALNCGCVGDRACLAICDMDVDFCTGDYVCGGPMQSCGSFDCEHPECFCDQTSERRGICAQNASCSDLRPCNSSSDCINGGQCVLDSCCGGGVCIRECGNCAPTGSSRRSQKAGKTALG